MRVENEVSGEFRHRGDGSTPKRFPLAAQPEIMRAAEKDDQYASYVYDACRDAFRHLFGTRYAVAYQSETKLLGQMLYYILTTGSGQQTLGEEYCDITQVASPYGLPPTPARRALFIVYQTAVPYLAERISSRMAAHGVILADSQPQEFHGSSDPGRNPIQSSGSENSSSSSTRLSVSALSRLKEKFHRLWLWAVQKWPSVLPYAREILQLVLRANLMFFYFEGLYYHISKRAAGIRYVFIGKPLNQRPRYQILGVFLLIQLCILGAEGLRRSNLSSIASSVHQTSLGAHQASGGRGLPILNEDGNLITDSNLHKGKGNWTSVVTGSEACEFLQDASFGMRNGSQIAKKEAHASKTPLEHNVILQRSCFVCFSPNLSVSANALSASVVANTQQQHPVVTSSVGTSFSSPECPDFELHHGVVQ